MEDLHVFDFLSGLTSRLLVNEYTAINLTWTICAATISFLGQI